MVNVISCLLLTNQLKVIFYNKRQSFFKKRIFIFEIWKICCFLKAECNWVNYFGWIMSFRTRQTIIAPRRNPGASHWYFNAPNYGRAFEGEFNISQKILVNQKGSSYCLLVRCLTNVKCLTRKFSMNRSLKPKTYKFSQTIICHEIKSQKR